MGRHVSVTDQVLEAVAKKASSEVKGEKIGLTAACDILKVNYGSVLARSKKVGFKAILALISKYAPRTGTKKVKAVSAKKAKSVKPTTKKPAKTPKAVKAPKVSKTVVPVIPATVSATEPASLVVSEAALENKVPVPA